MTFQETISAYIQERYQITPDFPFEKHPDYLVFRHPRNAKLCHWMHNCSALPRISSSLF